MNSSLRIGNIAPSKARRLPAVVERLGEFASFRGLETYLVGGVLRDSMMGRDSRDIDVAVIADPYLIGQELASFLAGRVFTLDSTKENVRVVINDNTGPVFIDICSIRQDIFQDLRRRDFTIDAMALLLSNSSSESWWDHLIDLDGGLTDLKDGFIRNVSSEVFKADPIRLLRAIRLSKQLRFQITEETKRLISRDSHLINQVASERVRDEFLKVLAEEETTASLRLLDYLGLLCEIIPELNDSKEITQNGEHYWDVFNHLIETPGQVEKILSRQYERDEIFEEAIPDFIQIHEYFAEEVSDGHTRLTMLKLAGLLHDIAKPDTKIIESSGRIRFLGHDVLGSKMSEEILQRLRMSTRGVESVKLMVKSHLRPNQLAPKGELPSGRSIYRYFRDLGGVAIDTLYLNLADYLAASGPRLKIDELLRNCCLIKHIMYEGFKYNSQETYQKLLNGNDIMSIFSIGPGPKIGVMLSFVQEAQLNGEIKNKEEAIKLLETNYERTV